MLSVFPEEVSFSELLFPTSFIHCANEVQEVPNSLIGRKFHQDSMHHFDPKQAFKENKVMYGTCASRMERSFYSIRLLIWLSRNAVE